jgi:alanine-synthesizing transaminase
VSRLEPFGHATNRLTRAIQARRERGAPILDLTESNPTAVGLEIPGQEVLAALATPAALRYEPDPRGLPSTCQAVADYYGERGYSVDPRRIHLASGTSEAYGWLFKLLAEPGDNVVAPRPSYPLLELLATLEGLEMRSYRLVRRADERWGIDFESLAAAIDERTRAVLVVNPNNPTGSFVKRDELGELTELCASRGLALIVDEVFSDFVLAEDRDLVPTLVDVTTAQTFVLSGISKALGLPQMKLAWIVSGGAEALRIESQERLDWIADTYLSVSTPVQHAAVEWLRRRSDLAGPIAQRVRANLTALEAAVRLRDDARLLVPEGGWYAVVEVPGVASEEEFVVSLLERDGVLVHPGHFYDFRREAFLVTSLLPEPATFQAGWVTLLGRISH